MKTSILNDLYSKVFNDDRVNVWHISIYVCLLDLWRISDYPKQIKITRKQLMVKAHVKSITTYHKCLDQLVELNYVRYIPTYNSYEGSSVEIII